MDSLKGSGAQPSITCSSCTAGNSHWEAGCKSSVVSERPCEWRMSCDVNLQTLRLLTDLLVSTFRHLQSILHIWARGVFKKWDWVLLCTCLKPSDEPPLCFKVNPNPLHWPSKSRLMGLCSALRPHLRPPHSYLCPADIDHSFRASNTTLSSFKTQSLCVRTLG